MYTYAYPRPALTVDAVVFGVNNEGLKLLLIKRRDDPFKDCWALPGGFVDVDNDETTEAAVARELQEETALSDLYLEQLYTFSKKGRDPRERVVTVAYYGLVEPSNLNPKAGDDAKEVQWFSVDALPELAFDHADIIKMGLNRLRGKVRYQPVGFELLPRNFTLNELQTLYEAILGKRLDVRNFRRKVLSTGVLKPSWEDNIGKGRPALLYQFDHQEYLRKANEGFSFEI